MQQNRTEYVQTAWYCIVNLEIFKPRRSKHCDACGKCVMVFDHHCPFLHNCIGAGNMKFFLPLLISIAIVVVNSTLLVAIGRDLSKLAVIQKDLSESSKFNVFRLEKMHPVGQVCFFTFLLFCGIVLILASFGVL